MSSNETKTVEVAPETPVKGEKKKSYKKWLLLLIPFLLLLLLLGYCAKTTVSSGELARRLAADGTDTIHLDGDVKVDEPLVVNGKKTITGNGKIILVGELDGEFPDGNKKSNSWGMGCTKLDIEDTDAMAALLNVSDSATLTINGSVKVDAANKANAIRVAKGGKLVVDAKSTIENGRYVNIVINEGATAEIKGGNVLNAQAYGIINAGTLKISGGTLSGAITGAVVYNTGAATQSGGTIEKAGVHNVYVAAGTFTMTGGKNDGAAKDGIVVQEDATAEIKDGDVENCVHGLCNNGSMKVGAITLKEAGIMNYKTGVLELNGTTVDTSAVYCLANNGGKVVAKNFTAKKCDTCAIYNFSGDMELIDVTVTGSRDGNIANGGGNLTVTGGTLEKCRDKSIVVGSGKAVFEDVEIAGTSREKYGVYVYGGELCITDAEVYDISSTAFKVDTGGYIEAKDIEMKDIAQIGFRADGGKIVAENVTMENLGSHAIYNMEGDITITGGKIDTIAKNGLQQKGGSTTLTDVEVDNIGNHAAYIALGKVTVTDSTFKNMEGNGFYLIEGDNEATLKNVVLDGVKKQGINNQSTMTIDGLTVKNATQNGIFNKDKGTITAKNVEISNVGEHGVNNYNTMSLTNAKISNTGNGSNGLQNKGTLTIEEVSVTNSKNHGAYNTGTIKGSGLTVKSAEKNGIYNNKGTFSVTKVTVNGTGEHGLNNAASMTVSEVTVKDTGKGKNSVQNSGTLSISKAILTGSKNHGIYNTGTISGKNVTVEDVAENGVYNAKGKIDSIDGLVINKTGSHGINNEATMVVSNLTVKNTGSEKNNIQNVGTLTVSTATLTGSKNHGIYNTGTISGKDVTVKDAAKNGIYNAKGTITVAGLTVDGVGEHGINNDATITVSNVAISGTGKEKNSIQNAGTATVSSATLKNSKNHGIYNTGKLSGENITVESPAGNGVYNNEGTVDAIAGLTVKNSGDQGVNNKGTFVASNVKVGGTAKNGIYNNGGTATVNGLNISNTGEHGVSNEGTMTVSDVEIAATGKDKNGIQNKGTLTTKGVVIDGSKNHGFYNAGTVTAKGDVEITNSEVNAVYNYQGEFKAEKVVADVTGEHGINNAATLEIGTVKVTNAGQNGIQNSGNMTVSESAVLNDSGKHGIYNGDSFYGENISINNAGDLALSNGGEMEVRGLDTVGTAHKAIYNSGYAELYTATIDGTNVANSGAEYLIDNNGGVLDLTDATIRNAKGTALHNRGKAATSVTNVVINTAGNYGTFVESGSSLSGDGLEINNITKGISGAEGMPIKNAGKITMLDHVTIGADDPEVTGSAAEVNTTLGNIVNNAIVNDATTASYSGYDLVVNNTTAGCAIYNKGIVYVTDFAADKPKDGIVSRISGWATLSGNVTITNTSRNPITTYGNESKGYANGVELTSGSTMTIDGAASHAINNKGSFLAAADTNITIKNVTGTNINAINNNGGTLALGNATIQDVYVDITVNSDTGKINTNSGTALMLSGPTTINGKVEISNIYTKPANGSTDNTNGSGVVVRKSGSNITGDGSVAITAGPAVDGYKSVHNGIFTDGCPIELKGDISIDGAANQGIYVANANASVKAANVTLTNIGSGHGVYVNNASGRFESTGNVTTNVTQRGLFNVGTMKIAGNVDIKGAKNNGIETSGQITVGGNVTIDMNNVAKRGIYIKGTDAKLIAANVSVSNTGDNAIEIDGTGSNKSNLTVTGDVTVNRTATGTKGININGGNASASVKNLTINNAGENAVYINNAKGNLTSTGTITVTFPGKKGISNTGVINAGNIVVTDLTGAQGSYYPIENSGTITATGDVTVARVVDAAGIRNKGTMTVNGTTTITDISGSKNVNGIQQDGGKTMTLNNVVISNVSQTTVTADYGNGMCMKGTLNLNGTATISNVNPDNTDTTNSANAGVVNYGTIKGTGSIVVDNVGGHGIYAKTGKFDLASVSVSNAGLNSAMIGIYLEGESNMKATTISIDHTGKQGIQLQHANTLTATTVTVKNAVQNGVRLYNNNSNPTVTIGTLTTVNCGQYGLAAQKQLTDANMTVSEMWYKNCTNGAVHGNIKSGVATPQELAE